MCYLLHGRSWWAFLFETRWYHNQIGTAFQSAEYSPILNEEIISQSNHYHVLTNLLVAPKDSLFRSKLKDTSSSRRPAPFQPTDRSCHHGLELKVSSSHFSVLKPQFAKLALESHVRGVRIKSSDRIQLELNGETKALFHYPGNVGQNNTSKKTKLGATQVWKN